MLRASLSRSLAILILTALVALLCIRPEAAWTVALICCWYMLLSGADWALHRHVLHANDSPIPEWRKAHRMHHLEFDGVVGRTHASLTFAHMDTLLIIAATSPCSMIIALVAHLTMAAPMPLWAFAVAHALFVTAGVGAHNYAHSVFHGYEPPRWRDAPRVGLPKYLCELLHEHHRKHHLDSGLNYCTVFLGFDWVVGSEAASEDAGFGPPHRYFSHAKPQRPAQPRASQQQQQPPPPRITLAAQQTPTSHFPPPAGCSSGSPHARASEGVVGAPAADGLAQRHIAKTAAEPGAALREEDQEASPKILPLVR